MQMQEETRGKAMGGRSIACHIPKVEEEKLSSNLSKKSISVSNIFVAAKNDPPGHEELIFFGHNHQNFFSCNLL